MSINSAIFEKPSCKFKFLEREGFHVPNYYELKSTEQVITLYNEYMQKKRDALNYDIDGLVEEVNDFDSQEALGYHPNGLNPKFVTSIKFDSVGAISHLKDIRWTVGTTGKIIPTGIFDPVDIMGVTITKASLHNFDLLDNHIKRDDLKIGSKVLIVRRGDVIPQLGSVIKEANPDGKDITIPTHCPTCDTQLHRFSVDLVCENPSCGAKVKGLFTNLFKTLDLKGVSGKFVDKAVEVYDIATISDLMELTVDDIEALPGFAKKSAQKTHDVIHSVKEVSAEQFFALLNIPNQGVRVFENLFTQFPAEKLLDNSFKPADIIDTKGIAETSAIAIHEGIQDNLDLMRENAKWFTIVKEAENTQSDTDHNANMVGKSFCITGALKDGTRKVYEQRIKDLGGKVGSVSKTLDYLVTNDTDSTSSKMKKVATINAAFHNNGQDKKINIINENELNILMEK